MILAQVPFGWASANLLLRYSSIRNTQMTDEVRKSIGLQQSSLAAASSSTQTEVAVVKRTLAEIQSRSTYDDAVDEEDGLHTTIVNLQDLMEALTLSQTLLQELQSMTKTAEIAKAAQGSGTTNNTFGANYNGMQTGTNYGSITWNKK